MKLKLISVSDKNYHALKRLGSAGDSFNDVISEMIKWIEEIKKRIGKDSG